MELEKAEELKKQVLQRRKRISTPEYDNLSNSAFRILTRSKYYREAKHILIFHPKRSAGEINTVPVIKHAMVYGKSVSLPKTDGQTKQLETYHIQSLLTDLQHGLFEIAEPIPGKCQETTFSEEIDLIIVPGTLFDIYGGRWGYGHGYYDRFLTAYKEKLAEKGRKMPAILGYAFDFQLISEDIPQKSSDFLVDGIITDKREVMAQKRM